MKPFPHGGLISGLLAITDVIDSNGQGLLNWNAEMVAITLPNGTDWFYANWVYRQLAADIAGRYDDHEIHSSLEHGQWFGHLNLAKMEPNLASKLIDALRTVALETTSGAVADWWPEDPKRCELYCGALSELATLIDQSGAMPKADS